MFNFAEAMARAEGIYSVSARAEASEGPPDSEPPTVQVEASAALASSGRCHPKQGERN